MLTPHTIRFLKFRPPAPILFSASEYLPCFSEKSIFFYLILSIILGSDLSNVALLFAMEENQLIQRTLRVLFEANDNRYEVIHILDGGFYKLGWARDGARRMSLVDFLNQLYKGSNRVKFFMPLKPNMPYYDKNFNQVIKTKQLPN